MEKGKFAQSLTLLLISKNQRTIIRCNTNPKPLARFGRGGTSSAGGWGQQSSWLGFSSLWIGSASLNWLGNHQPRHEEQNNTASPYIFQFHPGLRHNLRSVGHGFAWVGIDSSKKFFDLLLDSPTGLLDSTDESISSNAQMDLLLAPDSSSLTASPPSRTPVVMIAHTHGSLIAAEKKLLGKFFGPHLQRTRTGQVTVRRIAKKQIFHLDFIAVLNDGAW